MHTNDTTQTKTTQTAACPACKGNGYTRQVWETDDGGAPWVLRPTCQTCQGTGVIPQAVAFVVAFVQPSVAEMLADLRRRRAAHADDDAGLDIPHM
jgi:hypothetical protein